MDEQNYSTGIIQNEHTENCSNIYSLVSAIKLNAYQKLTIVCSFISHFTKKIVGITSSSKYESELLHCRLLHNIWQSVEIEKELILCCSLSS